MARYKPYDYRQTKMLPVRFEEQILPGTFEHTLNRLIDESIDLTVFEARYRNDDGGAPAYDPAVLLKIILLAYSRGITSSRQIERLCRENVLFMAISAHSQPHFTTIAHFIATLDREISKIFDKMERAVRHLTQRHRREDASGEDAALEEARAKQQATLEKAIAKVRGFLQGREDKIGKSGRVKQSNTRLSEALMIDEQRGDFDGSTRSVVRAFFLITTPISRSRGGVFIQAR
jgi:transposase